MKMLKDVRNGLYHLLVETNVYIKYHHKKYVSDIKCKGKYNPVLSLLYLAKLTLFIRVLRLRKYRGYTGKPYYSGSESEISKKGTPQSYADKLLKYDVVSFDVFDTLVLRPFQEPTDLFYIVGQKLEYMDFADIRAQAEQKIRSKMQKKKKSGEISIHEIYGYLEKYCGIDAKSGISAEYETETDLIYPNPFMKQVYDIVKNSGKKIIAVTDMYLTGEMIKNILNKCGYTDISEIFVSNEHQCGKYNGKLFKKVKEKIGKNFTYVHIGDNWQSDFESPKKYKIDSVYYENVNSKGGYYRPYDMSAVAGSAYRGIVNAHFYSGANKYTMAYEYGFMCGGIFVLGYCGFIHEYAKTNRIDKILFLARDGEVLKKVYDNMYPGNNSEYVYWSRNAAAKLGCRKYKHDYFRRFIYHKVNKETSVKKIFKAMETEILLPKLEKELNISGETALNSKNADKIVKFLASHFDEVYKIYEDENKAAKKYYKKVTGENKRICTVDIGWAGSGGVILAHLVRDIWNIDCEMFTILAGTNTAHNYEPNMSEGFLQSGQMTSYMYSQRHNRDLYRFHNPEAMHNVFFEILLSSKSASLKGFKTTGNNNGYDFVFAEENHDNDDITDEIHRGIYDFIEIYNERFEKYGYMKNISGSDAYAPFRYLTADNNKYFKKLFGGVYFEIGVGDEKKTKIFKNSRKSRKIR